MPVQVLGSSLFPPPADRDYALELLYVPPEVADLAPPVGTTWNVSPSGSPTIHLPTYRSTDGTTGYRFALTVSCASAPPVCSGDANCDGVVNWRDIDYFVAGMGDNVPAWEGLFWPGVPCCPFENCDTNLDGTVNWRDIDPFVAMMGAGCPN